MIDTRMVFLVLTGLLLAILIAIAAVVMRKNSKKRLEDPKFRMMDDD